MTDSYPALNVGRGGISKECKLYRQEEERNFQGGKESKRALRYHRIINL
jgi:hypothetical protein